MVLCSGHIEMLFMFQAFMEYNAPADWSKGRDYEKTLMGSMLSLSPIPEPHKSTELFSNPSTTPKQEHDITEKNIWQVCSRLNF